MATITHTNLATTKQDHVVWPEYGPPITIPAGTVLWMHGSRPSSMGGWIGTFSRTYQQANGYSPNGYTFSLKTDNVERLY